MFHGHTDTVGIEEYGAIKEWACNPDEFTYPPSVLKMKDLKPWYNVQTASEAFVYFNYFVHNASIEEITNQLKKSSRRSNGRHIEKD